MVEIDSVGTFEVKEGKRLILAIEEHEGWTSCTMAVRNHKKLASFVSRP